MTYSIGVMGSWMTDGEGVTPYQSCTPWVSSWSVAEDSSGEHSVLPQISTFEETESGSHSMTWMTSSPAIVPRDLVRSIKAWFQLSKPSRSQVFSILQRISPYGSPEVLDLYEEFLDSEHAVIREGATRGIIAYLDHQTSSRALSMLNKIATFDKSSEIRRLAQDSFEVHS